MTLCVIRCILNRTESLGLPARADSLAVHAEGGHRELAAHSVMS
jgi:hypothetical protein